MTEQIIQCLLCGHSHSKPFDRTQFHNREVLNRICTNCGLVYQSPRMTEEELNEFYKAEYRKIYQGGEGPSQEDLNTQKARAESLNNFAQQHIDQISRHLDIGASAGALLGHFQNTFNNHSVGIEPGEAYRMHAQSQGLKVYNSLNDLQRNKEANFDLISMSHVLEHIPDPVDYLRNLREEILTPDGWLLIEVPNLYAHVSFEIAHLLSFSPHTLEQTLEQAEFKVVKMIEHGWPRSQIIPLYLTVLARPSQKQKQTRVRPERMVSIKRKLGFLRKRILTRLMPKRAWIPKT